MIPISIKLGLDDYRRHGIPTGDFLRAVLANDLFAAVGRADEQNVLLLKDICSHIYNELPRTCWGSYAAVDAWIARHAEGREGKPEISLEQETA